MEFGLNLSFQNLINSSLIHKAKYPNRKFVQRFIMRNSSVKRSGVACVNKGSQFYLPPTRLSTSGMNHTCLYFPATEYSFPVPLRVGG